ncbi:MAG TPA: hypothetical protein VF040_02330, partial [Ktedonobacterales bacterium]
AGWSVSPSGRMVIYIDAHTGALHSIRADALNDTVVGTVTNGKAPVAGFWATPAGMAIAGGIAWSPDNMRVAYVAQNGSETALHVMTATGSADTIARLISGGFFGRPLWSADSISIAFATTHSGTQSISVYNITTSHLLTIAAQSDASDGAAMADDLAWLPGDGGALTWSTQDNGAVTGIFRADANTSDSAVRLTPEGVRYAVAGVSASGTWLLSRDTVLEEIAAGQSSPQFVATLAHPITQICWAPSGNVAAVVAGDSLALLTSSHAVAAIAHGLTAQSVVAWSSDSTALAWQSGRVVMSARIAQGSTSMQKMVAQEAGVLALMWSPDGQSLAAQAPSGVVLMSADGAQMREVDGAETSGTQFAWSLSG